MKKHPLTSKQSGELDDALKLFENWRQNKTGRARIPDGLWQAAVDLYHVQGITINQIASILRLNYSTLKDKICDQTDPAPTSLPVDEEASMFIEVPSLPDCSDCVIEMENQSGMKMRISFKGRADPAVMSLGKYLLSGVP